MRFASVEEYLGAGMEKQAGPFSLISETMKNFVSPALETVGTFGAKMTKEHPWITAGTIGAIGLSELAPWVSQKITALKNSRAHDKMIAQLISSDDMLDRADRDELKDAYKTMVNFAPSIAADPNAARSFLRSAVASGGGVDFNTLKLLAETENEATGRWKRKD
jgi:hypothetical protein